LKGSFFIEILANLTTIEHLTKVDFHEQNWPNDSKVDCKSTSKLVKLNETNANFGRKV
jgi:hypothetical protein